MGEPGQHNEKTKKTKKLFTFFIVFIWPSGKMKKPALFFSFDILIIQDELRGIPKCTVSLCSTAPQGPGTEYNPRCCPFFFNPIALDHDQQPGWDWK